MKLWKATICIKCNYYKLIESGGSSKGKKNQSWCEILKNICEALSDTARALLGRSLTSECRFIRVVQGDKLQISIRNVVNPL